MQAVETPITTKGAAVLALGILSSLSDARFKLRRTVLRDSWLRFPNSRVSVQARFVVRCGQHQEPVTPWHAVARAENTSGDMLCAAAPTSDGRLRGPIIALVWWLRHATVAFPMAAFYGKCDDDVYLHLPSVENMLRGVPLALASQAYVGYVMYAQLELSISSSNPNETRYEFHAFAPTAIFSRLASKPQSRCRESRGPGSRSAHTPTNTHSCFGPLPFQCGPFYAIGRRAVHALLRSRRALDADLRHLRALPPSHPKVLDDAWMGAALWRFVGSRMSIAVLALGGPPLSNPSPNPNPTPTLTLTLALTLTLTLNLTLTLTLTLTQEVPRSIWTTPRASVGTPACSSGTTASSLCIASRSSMPSTPPSKAHIGARLKSHGSPSGRTAAAHYQIWQVRV